MSKCFFELKPKTNKNKAYTQQMSHTIHHTIFTACLITHSCPVQLSRQCEVKILSEFGQSENSVEKKNVTIPHKKAFTFIGNFIPHIHIDIGEC